MDRNTKYACAKCPAGPGERRKEKKKFTREELLAHISADHIRYLPYACVHCNFVRLPTEFYFYEHMEQSHPGLDIRTLYQPDKKKKEELSELLWASGCPYTDIGFISSGREPSPGTQSVSADPPVVKLEGESPGKEGHHTTTTTPPPPEQRPLPTHSASAPPPPPGAEPDRGHSQTIPQQKERRGEEEGRKEQSSNTQEKKDKGEEAQEPTEKKDECSREEEESSVPGAGEESEENADKQPPSHEEEESALPLPAAAGIQKTGAQEGRQTTNTHPPRPDGEESGNSGEGTGPVEPCQGSASSESGGEVDIESMGADVLSQIVTRSGIPRQEGEGETGEEGMREDGMGEENMVELQHPSLEPEEEEMEGDGEREDEDGENPQEEEAGDKEERRKEEGYRVSMGEALKLNPRPSARRRVLSEEGRDVSSGEGIGEMMGEDVQGESQVMSGGEMETPGRMEKMWGEGREPVMTRSKDRINLSSSSSTDQEERSVPTPAGRRGRGRGVMKRGRGRKVVISSSSSAEVPQPEDGGVQSSDSSLAMEDAQLHVVQSAESGSGVGDASLSDSSKSEKSGKKFFARRGGRSGGMGVCGGRGRGRGMSGGGGRGGSRSLGPLDIMEEEKGTGEGKNPRPRSEVLPSKGKQGSVTCMKCFMDVPDSGRRMCLHSLRSHLGREVLKCGECDYTNKGSLPGIKIHMNKKHGIMAVAGKDLEVIHEECFPHAPPWTMEASGLDLSQDIFNNEPRGDIVEELEEEQRVTVGGKEREGEMEEEEEEDTGIQEEEEGHIPSTPHPHPHPQHQSGGVEEGKSVERPGRAGNALCMMCEKEVKERTARARLYHIFRDHLKEDLLKCNHCPYTSLGVINAFKQHLRRSHPGKEDFTDRRLEFMEQTRNLGKKCFPEYGELSVEHFQGFPADGRRGAKRDASSLDVPETPATPQPGKKKRSLSVRKKEAEEAVRPRVWTSAIPQKTRPQSLLDEDGDAEKTGEDAEEAEMGVEHRMERPSAKEAPATKVRKSRSLPSNRRRRGVSKKRGKPRKAKSAETVLGRDYSTEEEENPFPPDATMETDGESEERMSGEEESMPVLVPVRSEDVYEAPTSSSSGEISSASIKSPSTSPTKQTKKKYTGTLRSTRKETETPAGGGVAGISQGLKGYRIPKKKPTVDSGEEERMQDPLLARLQPGGTWVKMKEA